MAESTNAPFANPVAVISPQYCASSPIDLAIVKPSAWGNFTVTDANGNNIFKIKEILFSGFASKKLILDPAGNILVTLRRKVMTAHSRWQVFRGESTDNTRDLLFNAKTHSIFYMKPKLDVFLASNIAEEVCDFKVKGSSYARSCVVYAGDDEDNTKIVAQMHKKHAAKSFFLGKDHFMVRVSPNIDYAFIVALIMIFDDINRPRGGSGAPSG